MGDHSITLHEKVTCIDEAHSALQKCVAEGIARAAGTTVEITGDDVLSLFILAIQKSELQQRLAHVAHVEMYLQGAAGNGFKEARFEEAGYAVSALQAALQFFLEERRPAGKAKGNSTLRSTTDVFSAYLQPADTEQSGDLDRAGMQLEGLVRQARAQGV